MFILTAGNRQGNEAKFTEQTADAELLHTIRFGGLEQAWVYKRPFPTPPLSIEMYAEPVVFGNRVQLHGAAAEIGSEQARILANWGLLAGGENGHFDCAQCGALHG